MHFKNLEVDFNTNRLRIRTLKQEDNLQSYLNWMRDESNKFILSINPKMSMEELMLYVDNKYEDHLALLLGIFELEKNKHIGNIKFEPIDFNNNYAVVGIMIGNKKFRGKGIAQEAITQSCIKIINSNGISRVLLGVNKANKAAIKAYAKSGFIVTDNPVLNLDKEAVEMVLYSDSNHI
jgi:RimJ/RimL family protein N-acetyltransferase